MSQRSSARGHQRTIIMFDIVPPGLYIKSTSLISPHKGRWQPVHHLSPFAFQWKRWVMWIRAEFCLMSFFYPPKRLKIGRGQLLTPLYFLTPNRKSNANLVWINSHNGAVLKCLVYIHIAVSLYSKLYGTERLTLSFHPCWWLLWWSSMSLKSYFGESQGCSLLLMKVITSAQGKYCQIKLYQSKQYL